MNSYEIVFNINGDFSSPGDICELPMGSKVSNPGRGYYISFAESLEDAWDRAERTLKYYWHLELVEVAES